MKKTTKVLFLPLLASMALTGCNENKEETPVVPGQENQQQNNETLTDDTTVGSLRLITRTPVNDAYDLLNFDVGHSFVMFTNKTEFDLNLEFKDVYQIYRPTEEYFTGVKANKNFSMYRNYLDMPLAEREARAESLVKFDKKASAYGQGELTIKPDEFFTLSANGGGEDYLKYLTGYLNVLLSKFGTGFDEIGDLIEAFGSIANSRTISFDQIATISTAIDKLVIIYDQVVGETIGANVETNPLDGYVVGTDPILDLVYKVVSFINEHKETLNLMLSGAADFFRQIDYLSFAFVIALVGDVVYNSQLGTLSKEAYQRFIDTYLTPLELMYPEDDNINSIRGYFEDLIDEYSEFDLLDFALEAFYLINTVTHSEEAADMLFMLALQVVAVLAQEEIDPDFIVAMIASLIASIYDEEEYAPVVEHFEALVDSYNEGEPIILPVLLEIVNAIEEELEIVLPYVEMIDKLLDGDNSIYNLALELSTFEDPQMKQIGETLVTAIQFLKLTGYAADTTNVEILTGVLTLLCDGYYEEISGFLGDIAYPGAGISVNQELRDMLTEYDYSNNAIYEVDITYKQLKNMIKATEGENYYSVLKHNCVTVTSKIWNAAVGLNDDGSHTCFYISAEGGLRHSIVDHPANLEQEIKRLSKDSECTTKGGRYIGLDLPNPLLDTNENRSDLPVDPSQAEFEENFISLLLKKIFSF